MTNHGDVDSPDSFAAGGFKFSTMTMKIKSFISQLSANARIPGFGNPCPLSLLNSATFVSIGYIVARATANETNPGAIARRPN